MESGKKAPLVLSVTSAPSLTSEVWVIEHDAPLTMRNGLAPTTVTSPATTGLFKCHVQSAPTVTWLCVAKLCKKLEIETQIRMMAHTAKVAPSVTAYAALDAAQSMHLFPKQAAGKAPVFVLFMEHVPYSLQNDLATVLATPADVTTLFDDIYDALVAMSLLFDDVFHDDAYPRNVLAYREEGTGKFRFLLADYGKLEDEQGTEERIQEWLMDFTSALARYMIRWMDADGTKLPALTCLPAALKEGPKIKDKGLMAILDGMRSERARKKGEVDVKEPVKKGTKKKATKEPKKETKKTEVEKEPKEEPKAEVEKEPKKVPKKHSKKETKKKTADTKPAESEATTTTSATTSPARSSTRRKSTRKNPPGDPTDSSFTECMACSEEAMGACRTCLSVYCSSECLDSHHDAACGK